MTIEADLRLWFRAQRYRWRTDPGEIVAMLRLLHPGDTAIDIGAHKGGYLWWMRRRVGATGAVVAFEPQQALAVKLREYAARPEWRNVTTEWLALSSRPGELSLSVPRGGPSPSASLEPHPEGGRDTVLVPVDTLDAYLQRNARGRVTFIKIDVEGHEVDVLQGAEGTISRDRPFVLMECEERHRHGTTAAVLEWFGARGYRGAFFLGGVLVPAEQFDHRRHQVVGISPYANNFLFSPVDRGVVAAR